LWPPRPSFEEACVYSRFVRGGLALAAVAAGLGGYAAAGSAHSAHSAAATLGTVDIYSSLPLTGTSTAQTIPAVNGIKLALAQMHGVAGDYKVNYTSLNDATAAAGEWDPTQTKADAVKAAGDSKAVYYIGEFNSGASEVSIPILNEAGIAQVSPANTYVGLTTDDPGSAPGEPAKYYPTGKRTYLRIVPIDSIQAAADLTVMKQDKCTKIAIANDQEAYGQGLATLISMQAAAYGETIVSNTGIDPTSPSFASYASTIQGQGADCFFFAGIVSNGAVAITKAVNAAIPTAKIFGGDGVCTSTYTNPTMGGVPASIDPLITCTVATQDLAAYPGGKAFLAAYKAAYHVSNPDPYAIYGYEAMSLGLDTIKSLGKNGNNRADVVKALFAIKKRMSVIGTYGFNANGDTTLKSYGVYTVGASGANQGDPVFSESVTPAHVLM
jgi:branched-chain amino acid transport system substrate-binding protein